MREGWGNDGAGTSFRVNVQKQKEEDESEEVKRKQLIRGLRRLSENFILSSMRGHCRDPVRGMM